MTEEERSERRRRWTALLLVPLLLVGAALCFWTLFASVTLGEAESFIPAPLGSDALANYGADELPGRLRTLSISIVEAVIRDRDPEEEDAGARATDVSESLKSPVPIVTLKPGDPTRTATSPPTATNTPVPTVTSTPTATITPSPSPRPSRTPTATHTDEPPAEPTSTSVPPSTPTPSKTPTDTSTPITPTATPTPLTPTATPTPLTPTPSNTPTHTLTPSITPMPSNTPTPSLTPDICSLITINNFSVNGSKVEWDMLNESGSSVSLTAISLTWPLANGNLWHVKVGGSEIWTGDDDPINAVMSQPWLPDADPELPNLVSKVLHFHFDNNAENSSYSGSVNFGTCSKNFNYSP